MNYSIRKLNNFTIFQFFSAIFRKNIAVFFWIISDSRQILRFSKKFGEISTKFHQNLASKRQNSIKKCRRMNNSFFIFEKSLAIFDWNFESGAVQRFANLVDLEKCCKMRIWTQKSASIQKRTSLPKFGGELFNMIQTRLRKLRSLHFQNVGAEAVKQEDELDRVEERLRPVVN